MSKRTYDVVLIGAGLAGLNAANKLELSGLDVLLIEASDRAGGRVRSDQLDGFTLDRGFQVFNPAYPAAQRTWKYADLNLRQLPAGIEIATPASRSLRLTLPRSWDSVRLQTSQAFAGRLAPLGRLPALLSYAMACGTLPPDHLRERPEMPLRAALLRWGVGARALARFVMPFLRGVFAEVDPLLTSRRYADLVIRSFVRGRPSVPAGGMEQLPGTLAQTLSPGTIQFDTTAHAIKPGVVETSQSQLSARAIIIATDGPTASRLVPGLKSPTMNALTTWYFTTPTPPNHAYLMIDSRGGPSPLANVIDLTGSVPEYSTTGRRLVAASAVGYWPEQQHRKAASAAVQEILGLTPGHLEEVATYPIRHALPQAHSPFPLRKPVDLGSGLFVIGDHRDTPSLQGALVSGERGAQAAARHIGTGKA